LKLAGRKGLVIGVETRAGGLIAAAMGLAGADLGLATMRADEGVLAARRIQRQLREAGRQATTYAFDVMLGQNVKVSTRQVAKELGGFDFLVSASDLPFTASLSRLTDSDLAHVTTVNYYAHVFALRAAADEFRRAGSGQALLVVQEPADRAGATAYEAAQAATLTLVKSLSEELRPSVGINALVVAGEVVADELGQAALALVSGDAAEVTGEVRRLEALEASAPRGATS
jgi:enoyl-[acyl-carrier-protein] reductase (NADH)